MRRSYWIWSILWLPSIVVAAAAPTAVFPESDWAHETPERLGLDVTNLDALAKNVGGRGVVIRHGYVGYTWGDVSKSGDVASACKPVLSHLLLRAVQDHRISSPDELTWLFEPRLKTINGGKDAAITWRHLASQTSGYGLADAPGQTWAYNDYALALYYDTLTQNVYQSDGDSLLEFYLAKPLQFQDRHTFNAFGPKDRPGRLALSVRDFARFGLLYLRDGRWGDRQLLDPKLVKLALTSPVDRSLRQSSGKEAEMLPEQRTIGGGKRITPRGPGQYSFNWWLNLPDKEGKELFDALPSDAFIASGHGGKRQLTVVRSWDLIVCWNDGAFNELDDPALVRAMEIVRDTVKDR
jgi:CubicO group peptidase (beta-lactamase class C family)